MFTTTNQSNHILKNAFEAMLNKHLNRLPKIGDEIIGKVLTIAKNEILIDFSGFNVGVARGQELLNLDLTCNKIQVGDEIAATILDLENEKGQIELSLAASGEVVWNKIIKNQEQKTIIEVTILGANKGGLLTRVYNMSAFLPVSQLASKHYPKVEGGDKIKIFKKLKKLIGSKIKAQIIDIEKDQEKVIISEKTIEQDKQKEKLKKYKIGQIIEGGVVQLFKFGAVIKFDKNLEGFAHISELAWQTINSAEEILKLEQIVKAQIINIKDSQVFLSLKKLEADPFEAEIQQANLKEGEKIKGQINSILSYGLLIQLTPKLKGLAYIGDLSWPAGQNIFNAYKIGDEREFKILKIDSNRGKIALGDRDNLVEVKVDKNIDQNIDEQKEKKEEEIKGK